jgi:hypothetical protein
MLNVWMTGHCSGTVQQLCCVSAPVILSISVQAREQMPAPEHMPQSICPLLCQTRLSELSTEGDQSFVLIGLLSTVQRTQRAKLRLI